MPFSAHSLGHHQLSTLENIGSRTPWIHSHLTEEESRSYDCFQALRTDVLFLHCYSLLFYYLHKLTAFQLCFESNSQCCLLSHCETLFKSTNRWHLMQCVYIITCLRSLLCAVFVFIFKNKWYLMQWIELNAVVITLNWKLVSGNAVHYEPGYLN